MKIFPSVRAALDALAAELVMSLRIGLALRGTASLAVPGGSTPVPLFQILRDAPLDWSRVDVTLTDERWVDEAHAASNASLVRRELLQGRARVARFHPLFDGGPTAVRAALPVWRSLQPVPRPLDAVVLGMGEDGHFASLFPLNTGLRSALDPASEPACVAMSAPTEPVSRISLNLAALCQARRLFLFVTGEKKRDVIRRAASQVGSSALPVAALLEVQRPVLETYWAP